MKPLPLNSEEYGQNHVNRHQSSALYGAGIMADYLLFNTHISFQSCNCRATIDIRRSPPQHFWNSCILKQWIALKTRSDWLVKLRISFAIYLRATREKMASRLPSVTSEEITQIDDENTQKATKFGLAVFKGNALSFLSIKADEKGFLCKRKLIVRNLTWKSKLNSVLAQSHKAIFFGGFFAFKQRISSSLKHDTVPRVNNFYCFYVKSPQIVYHYGIVQEVNDIFYRIVMVVYIISLF